MVYTAIAIIVAMALICALVPNTTFRVNDTVIRNPLAKGLFGPIVLMVIGLAFLVLGAILASPLLLWYLSR